MTKKVVILGSAHPLRGGLASYNERLAKAYQDQGCEVEIITFSLQYPGFLFPGKTQYSDEPAPKDIKISVEVNSVNPLNWIKVGQKIRKMKPDLMITKFWIPFMGSCLGTIAKIVRKNKFTKVISIIDNIIPHEKRPGDKILANYFVRNVDAFMCMSQSVFDDMKMFTKTKPVGLSPHPLYDNFGLPMSKTEARKLLGLDENGKYLLFFGFIRDYKGLDLLMKAMSNSEIYNSDIKLIVAGEFYTDSKPYLDLIDELRLKDKLILATDFIPDSKVNQYFSAADLVVQPYKDATQSGVTQIAYYFEKPMVVTNVGGLAEIVPHGKAGYVVDVNPEKIAESIFDFYQNNREEEMIQHCRKEKEKYSWEEMLRKIGELIHH